MPDVLLQINPDINVPWNNLPLLPIGEELNQIIDIKEKLGDATAALARLHDRSIVIPNQGVLIITISLQEAKTSSAIENFFITNEELYRILSK
jgi:Fic family protein